MKQVIVLRKDIPIAHLIVGPLFLKSRKDTSVYTYYAQKLKIRPEDLIDALIEISAFSYNKVHLNTRHRLNGT